MQNTQVRGKGELLGELPFFFRLRHIYTAQVGKAATTLYVLSHDSYQQVCASYADDSVAVLEVITDTVEKAGVTKSQSSWNTSLTQDSGAIESAVKVKQTIDDAIKRLGERHIISFIESASKADVAAVKHALEAASVQVRPAPHAPTLREPPGRSEAQHHSAWPSAQTPCSGDKHTVMHCAPRRRVR